MKLILSIIIVLSFLVPSVGTAGGEIDLYDLKGKALVYIDPFDESAIYTWRGDAVAYLVGECGSSCTFIYTWEGSHIGFFANGIVFDLQGDIVGTTQGVMDYTYYPPEPKHAKGEKYPKNDRYAPAVKEPNFSYTPSKWSLEDFMTQDNS